MTKAADILITALKLQGTARAAYLDQACEGDRELRQRLEALIRCCDEPAQANPPPGGALPENPTQRVDDVADSAVLGPTGSLPMSTSASEGSARFGDYELLEEIARGGMGVVWQARQVSLNRVVALKMILSGRFADETEVRRFRNEAQAAAQLQHPNIVAIHEIGAVDGRHFFSMDYVAGRSLSDLCHAGPLPPERAARYVRDVARAIEFAHQNGVLHRDLKPSNVLIDATDQPRVTDFGIARLDTDRGLTRTGAALGTPSYMPPEQAAGNNANISPASDVYSMGAILYELLTGRPPFQAATVVETLRQAMETEPASPRWINPSVPTELDTVCLKCLEKEPFRRYGTAKELADDLGRFLRHEPIVARPATPWERGRKWARRKPAHAWLVAVSALALFGVVIGTLWYNQRLNIRLFETEMEQARAERLLGHRQESLDKIAAAAAIQPSPSLRAEAIQTLSLPGIRRVLATNIGTIAFTRFSRDGSMVAVGADYPARLDSDGRSFIRDARVMIFATATSACLGQAPWMVEGGGFDFSSDGSALAVPQETGKVMLFSPRDGRVRGDVPMFGTPSFSPDGRGLAITTTNGVVVYSYPELRPGPTRPGAVALLAWLPDAKLLLQETREDGSAQLWRWDPQTGAEISLTLSNEAVVATSADGRVGVFRKIKAKPAERRVDHTESLEARDLINGRLLAHFPGPMAGSVQCRLSEDGRRLIYPDHIEPGRMRVWDVASGLFLTGLGGPTARLCSVFERPYWHFGGLARDAGFTPSKEHMTRSSVDNFSHDGTLLAIESWGATLELDLWEADSGRRWATLSQALRPVWSPNDRWIAVTGQGVVHAQIGKAKLSQHGNVALELWEVTRSTPVFRQSGPMVPSLTFSTDGQHLAAGRVWWDVQSNGPHYTLRQTPLRGEPMEQILLGDDFAWFLTGPGRAVDGGIVAIRRFATDAPHGKLPGPGIRLGAGLTPDGRRLLIASPPVPDLTNNLVAAAHFQLWNLPERRLDAIWPHPQGRYQRTGPIAFSPDQRRVAAACFNRQGIELWDAENGQRLAVYGSPVAPSPQGGLARLRSLFGQPQEEPLVEAGVRSILFTPDSRQVISQSQSQVVVRQVDTGRQLANIRCGTNFLCMAVSPDGQTLATGDQQNRICLWKLPSGRELAYWPAHDAPVTALSFTPDGRVLASGGNDGAIKLWHLRELRRSLAVWGLDW